MVEKVRETAAGGEVKGLQATRIERLYCREWPAGRSLPNVRHCVAGRLPDNVMQRSQHTIARQAPLPKAYKCPEMLGRESWKTISPSLMCSSCT